MSHFTCLSCSRKLKDTYGRPCANPKCRGGAICQRCYAVRKTCMVCISEATGWDDRPTYLPYKHDENHITRYFQRQRAGAGGGGGDGDESRKRAKR
jgi:hypothetical protein